MSVTVKSVPGVALGLCLALALAACVRPGEKTPEPAQVLKYDDWDNFNRKLSSGKILFGAGTDTHPENRGVYSMLAVMFAPSCYPDVLSVTYDLDAPAAKSVKSQPATGEIRVDDQPPLKTSFTYEMTQGKAKVFIDFPEALANESRVDQFINGQMVSCKAVVEGREMSFRFTLKNHVGAMKRAFAQCKEEAAFSGNGPQAAPAVPGMPGQSGTSPARTSGQGAPAQGSGNPMGSAGKSAPDDSRYFK